jgi:hypothetical protein
MAACSDLQALRPSQEPVPAETQGINQGRRRSSTATPRTASPDRPRAARGREGGATLLRLAPSPQAMAACGTGGRHGKVFLCGAC